MVPDGVPWMVTAIGRDNFPIMAVTIALGGHVRTGLEDVVYTAPGRHAQGNAELVQRAVTLCEAIGRPVANPAVARDLLGIQEDATACSTVARPSGLTTPEDGCRSSGWARSDESRSAAPPPR